MNIALSDSEVSRLSGMPVITYNVLRRCGYPCVGSGYVILVRTSPNFGHYVALLHRNDGVLEFFDPYGILPDGQLRWNSPGVNVMLDQAVHHLSRILNSFPGRLEYNNHRFQKSSPMDLTCGRHCAVRLRMLGMNLEQYNNFVRYLCRKLRVSPSKLVTIISSLLY